MEVNTFCFGSRVVKLFCNRLTTECISQNALNIFVYCFIAAKVPAPGLATGRKCLLDIHLFFLVKQMCLAFIKMIEFLYLYIYVYTDQALCLIGFRQGIFYLLLV